jgi:UV DNA damage endonuclease
MIVQRLTMRREIAMRLGFACKVLGAAIPSHDARKWKSKPHLRVSIEYLHTMFEYLAEHDVRMYRMSSDLAPYYTDPSRPQFGSQLAECRDELEALGRRAAGDDLRLSTHPGQYVVLNSPDEDIYRASIRDLDYHAELLDLMEQPDSAKIVLHVGGVYGDRATATARWIARYHDLSERVRARLVLENDDRSYSAADVLNIHGETGVPITFDVLHHAVLNPNEIPESEALGAALQTWPNDQTPKIHYSDERVQYRHVRRKGGMVDVPPLRGQHADMIDADRFLDFLSRSQDMRDFDIMLESKCKDLALFQLQDELASRGYLLRAA